MSKKWQQLHWMVTDIQQIIQDLHEVQSSLINDILAGNDRTTIEFGSDEQQKLHEAAGNLLNLAAYDMVYQAKFPSTTTQGTPDYAYTLTETPDSSEITVTRRAQIPDDFPDHQLTDEMLQDVITLTLKGSWS